MKKIFTLLCCAVMAFTATAQIEILQADKKTVVKEGETIEIKPEENELFPGFSTVEYDGNAPYIVYKGEGSTDLTVTVTKKNPADKELSWCLGTSCAQMTNFTETRKVSGRTKADTTGLALHVKFENNQYKTVSVEVNVKAGDFTQKFYIDFVYAEAAGIEAQQADQITIANKQLSYNFNNGAEHILNIYGVSGRLVKTATLAQHGNVALNDLQHGVYIYEVLTDGKRTAAHKFVIR